MTKFTARFRTKSESDSVELEPWIKEQLSSVDKENKKKRIAKIRELKLMQIEQKTELEVLKQGSELQKIKREMKISNSGEADAFAKSLSTNPAMQDKWVSYTDQQRAIIMAGLQSAKNLGSDGGMAGYMLLAQMNSKPTSTLKDMLEVVQVLSKARGEGNESKNIVDAIRLGFDMSTKNRPQESSPGNIFKETMNLLKPFYEALATKDKEMYRQQFEVLKSQIRPLGQQMKEYHELEKIMRLQKDNFYSQLELENVEILKLKKSGEMIEIHIKIPAATIAKIVMAKIIDSTDVKKLLLIQPENSTSPSEIDS